MKYCEHCGFQIPDNSKFCPGCGAKKETQHTSDLEFVSPEKSMPRLSKDEILVKRYVCAQIKYPKCNGYLSVTNKRVIFHGSAKRGVICKEVALSSVSGLDCFHGRNLKLGRIILGALLVLCGLGTIVTFISALIMIALGAFLIYDALRESYILVIYSSAIAVSPICVGAGTQGFINNSAFSALVCTSTKETSNMIKDLGALIADLQTMGDDAIPLWQNK